MKYSAFSNKLEEIRSQKVKRNGRALSLREISLESNTGYAYIYRVFHGDAMPSRIYLFKICKALQCSEQEASSIFKLTDYRAPESGELDDVPAVCAVA